MTGKYRLQRSFKRFDQDVAKEVIEYPGVLGVRNGGQYLVEVPNRPGYYYVRLLNNLSELIVAFNNGKISPVYDLPVLVTRNPIDKNRWYIVGRDAGRYGNWGSTAYLANHGAQHSFDPISPGNDPVWVWPNQFMALNAIPSGSNGALTVVIEPSYYYIDGVRKYIGMTGSPDLSSHKPTTSGTSKFVLLYANSEGNIGVIDGTSFSHVISGTYGVNPYIPQMGTTTGVPIKAIRLETGTSYISWASMYDVRPFFDNGGGGSGGGSASGSIVGYTPERVVYTNTSGTMTTNPLLTFQQRISNDPYRNVFVVGSNKTEPPGSTIGTMTNYNFAVVDNYGENTNSGSGSYGYPMAVFTYGDAPVFDWYFAQGTQDQPMPVPQDYGLYYNQFYFYNSGTNAWVYAGGIEALASEDLTANGRGIRYNFKGATTGSANSNGTIMLELGGTYAKFNGLVQVPATNAYYWGDYNTTGSWRQMLSGNTMIWQKRVGTSWVTMTQLNPGTYTSGSAGTVKVSSVDTTDNYLYNKISGSTGIAISKVNAGGNESLVITNTVSAAGSITGTANGDILYGVSGSVRWEDRFRYIDVGTGKGLLIGKGVNDPANDYYNFQNGLAVAFDSWTGTNARGVGIYSSCDYGPFLEFYRARDGFSGSHLGNYVHANDEIVAIYGYGIRQEGNNQTTAGYITLTADRDFTDTINGHVFGTTWNFAVRNRESQFFSYPLTMSSAAFTVGTSFEIPVGSMDVSGSITQGQHTILLTNTSPMSVLLPSTSVAYGRQYTFKNVSGTVAAIVADATDLIDGTGTRHIFNKYDVLRIVSDGAGNWWVV